MAEPAIRAVDVYVGVGSNIEAAEHLRMACRELDARFGPLCLSSVYRTRAVGFQGDNFLNMVICFLTSEPPRVVLEVLEGIHELAGRKRGSERFGPRTLDLDLLLYGDTVSAESGIEIPRGDIGRYGFVLAPLAELAPDLVHPVTGETMESLWARCPEDQQPLEKMEFSALP